MGLEPEPFWLQYGWIVWTVLLVLAGILIGLFWRRQRLQKAAKTSPDPSSPWRTLEDELDRIAEAFQQAKLDDRQTFLRLSAVLRQGLELKHGFAATGQTLHELERSLHNLPGLSANFQEELLEFLRLSDRVKFAEHAISIEDTGMWIKRVRMWIQSLQGEAACVSL